MWMAAGPGVTANSVPATGSQPWTGGHRDTQTTQAPPLHFTHTLEYNTMLPTSVHAPAAFQPLAGGWGCARMLPVHRRVYAATWGHFKVDQGTLDKLGLPSDGHWQPEGTNVASWPQPWHNVAHRRHRPPILKPHTTPGARHFKLS